MPVEMDWASRNNQFAEMKLSWLFAWFRREFRNRAIRQTRGEIGEEPFKISDCIQISKCEQREWAAGEKTKRRAANAERKSFQPPLRLPARRLFPTSTCERLPGKARTRCQKKISKCRRLLRLRNTPLLSSSAPISKNSNQLGSLTGRRYGRRR
jgi:hypothetical protein